MIWKDVVGYEGRYEVSDMGQVRNAKTKQVLRPGMTGSKRKSGQYPAVGLRHNPTRLDKVHLLVLAAFRGPKPSGAIGMHQDDDPRNNRLSNLRWGTHTDNARDTARKRRGGSQKLGPEDVAVVRDMRTAGVPGKDVAALFQVSMQRVCDLHKGRTCL